MEIKIISKYQKEIVVTGFDEAWMETRETLLVDKTKWEIIKMWIKEMFLQ